MPAPTQRRKPTPEKHRGGLLAAGSHRHYGRPRLPHDRSPPRHHRRGLTTGAALYGRAARRRRGKRYRRERPLDGLSNPGDPGLARRACPGFWTARDARSMWLARRSTAIISSARGVARPFRSTPVLSVTWLTRWRVRTTSRSTATCSKSSAPVATAGPPLADSDPGFNAIIDTSSHLRSHSLCVSAPIIRYGRELLRVRGSG